MRSGLFEKINNQPLKESVGDVLQFLSRNIAPALMVVVAALGIAIAVDTGVKPWMHFEFLTGVG